MASNQVAAAPARIPLSPARVFDAAITLADTDGIEAVTMRAVAEELDVEAMSLYYHVANKDAMLDGMVNAVIEEIERDLGGFTVPDRVYDWQAAVRARIMCARDVMLRHPWAAGVLETRTAMSPAILRYFDGLLGLMHTGGCSWDLVHHAAHALGTRALGFSGELFVPDDTEAGDEEAEAMLAAMAESLPHMVGMLAAVSHDEPESTVGWCDDQREFVFALDILLDGIEGRRAAE